MNTSDPSSRAAASAPEPRARVLAWLRAFVPAPFPVNVRERLRVMVGAFVGVLFATAMGRFIVGPAPTDVWLLAPIGAASLLVFSAPASPLAQPWAVVGGNVVSAVIGMACASEISDAAFAAASAIALAIIAMFALRCLHPPGGASAFLAVLMHSRGQSLPLRSLLIESLLLVAAGVLYNSLTRRPYPHPQLAPAQPGAGSLARFSAVDFDVVLTKYNQVLDVSRDDLQALLQAVGLEGYRHRIGDLRCKDVMSRDLHWVEPGSSVQVASELIRAKRIKALPVLDTAGRVAGILTQADFLRANQAASARSFGAHLRALMKLQHTKQPTTMPQTVAQIMSRDVCTADQDRHILDLLPIFAETGHHHVPIVDADYKAVGMLTQSDFLRALHQGSFLAPPR